MNGQKFKGRYSRAGYNQRSFARAIPVTVQTMTRKVETDAFTIKEMKKIQELLNLSPEELVDLFFKD